MLPNTHAASTPSLSSSVYRNSAWWRVAVNRMVSWLAGTTSRTRCSSAATLSSALGERGVVGGDQGSRQTGAVKAFQTVGVSCFFETQALTTAGCLVNRPPQTSLPPTYTT